MRMLQNPAPGLHLFSLQCWQKLLTHLSHDLRHCCRKMPVSQPIWSLRGAAGGEQLLGSLKGELEVLFIPLGDTHKIQTQLGTVKPALPLAQGAAVIVFER